MSLSNEDKLKAIARYRELLPYAWLCENPDCDGLNHEGRPNKHARAEQTVGDDYITAFITGRGWG